MKLRLTKALILALADDPEMVGKHLYDAGTSGLSVYFGKSKQTFYLQARLPNGKKTRIKLGPWPLLTVSNARDEAAKIHAEILNGIDPVEAKRQRRSATHTLQSKLDEYIRLRNLKASTRREYRHVFERHFSSLLNRDYRQVDEGVVLTEFARVSKAAGKATANKAFRYLRAVLGMAFDLGEGRDFNPVRILSRRNMFHKITPRTRVVPLEKVGSYLLAIDFVRDTADKRVTGNICDLAEVILLTLNRLSETAQLKWSESVRLDSGVIFLADTKGRFDVWKPLSSQCRDIFQRRYDDRVSDWVFDGRPVDGEIGKLNNPNKTFANIAEIADVGPITAHDLRRTANSLATRMGMTNFERKILMHHSRSGEDVTDSYSSPEFDPEHQRTLFQRVADEFYRQKEKARIAGWEPKGLQRFG